MTFSIIIPLYNASDTIINTLDSCIGQTLPPKEIIIIDDCSSDEILTIIGRQMRSVGEGKVQTYGLCVKGR